MRCSRAMIFVALTTSVYACTGGEDPTTSRNVASSRKAAATSATPTVDPDLSGMVAPLRAYLERLLHHLHAQTEESPQRAQACAAVGRLLLAFDRPEASRAALECSLRIEPDDADAHYYLGHVDANVRPEDALSSFSRALELEPGDVAVRLRVAETQLELGRHEQAKVDFEKVLATGESTARAERGLGLVALGEGDPEAAIRHLESSLRNEHRASRLHFHLGRGYRDRGDLETARDHLQRAGDVEVAWNDKRLDHLADLRTSSALEAALEFAQKPAASDLSDFLGFTFSRLGDVEGAAERFEETQHGELEPAVQARLHLAAAGLWARRGDDSRSLAHLRRAARVAPDDASVRLYLGNGLARAGNSEAAIDAYTETLALGGDPETGGEAIRRRAMLRAAQGDRSGARRELETLARQDAEDVETARVLARLEATEGDTTAALARLEQARSATGLDAGSTARLHATSAEILQQAGTHREALAHYRSSLEADPDDPDTLLAAGNLAAHLRLFAEAEPYYRRALTIEPTSDDALTRLAAILLLDDRAAASLETLESARPEAAQPAARLLQARLLACHPETALRDPARALELALSHRDETLESYTTLAMVAAAGGDAPLAVRWQDDAIRLADSNAVRAGLTSRRTQYEGERSCEIEDPSRFLTTW